MKFVAVLPVLLLGLTGIADASTRVRGMDGDEVAPLSRKGTKVSDTKDSSVPARAGMFWFDRWYSAPAIHFVFHLDCDSFPICLWALNAF